VREAHWREQFKGKTLSDHFKLDDDIANITGATLSSRNVMNGVKRLLALAQVALQP
jgi:Na+-translocating ferredoxin:NAD+ oxidoreductase RnfG subunit